MVKVPVNCQPYAKGRPIYKVRVHVLKEENRMQRASFELLEGALF